MKIRGVNIVIEPTEFSVFGVAIGTENILDFQSTLSETYRVLTKEISRWEDIGFCKREIASLWDGIVAMMSKLVVRENMSREMNPREIRESLVTDEDNLRFLSEFGAAISKSETFKRMLHELEEIQMEQGSLSLSFRDRISKKTTQVKIEIERMFDRIERQSENVRNSLGHFVEWAKTNIKPIITCSMVTGIVMVSLVAISFMNVPIGIIRLYIMA
ncbi:MAG: hypothetical protein WCC94_08480, partial [Candidatus Bathyarchaeia archaeon]